MPGLYKVERIARSRGRKSDVCLTNKGTLQTCHRLDNAMIRSFPATWINLAIQSLTVVVCY